MNLFSVPVQLHAEKEPMVSIFIPVETETKCLFAGQREWFLNKTEETLIAVVLLFPDYLLCPLRKWHVQYTPNTSHYPVKRTDTVCIVLCSRGNKHLVSCPLLSPWWGARKDETTNGDDTKLPGSLKEEYAAIKWQNSKALNMYVYACVYVHRRTLQAFTPPFPALLGAL